MKKAWLYAALALIGALVSSYGLPPKEARVVLKLGFYGTLLSLLVYLVIWSLQF